MKRILIIKPSALGDVATTLPLLCDLRATLPDARIDWLIHPAYASLIQTHDALNGIIPFDRKQLAAWYFKPAAFAAFRRLIKTLRQNKYDIVIDAQGLFRSGFLARITGAKTRIGFAHAREGAAWAYTHKILLPDNGQHTLAVDRMRALGKPLNTNIASPAQFRLPIPPISHSAFRIPHSFIAVIPGARWNTKRWPIDRYTALAQHLLHQNEYILLLGSPDEKPLCDQLIQSLSPSAPQSLSASAPQTASVTNLAGQTSLPQMIALLNQAKLIIANDSGPLHIAAALDRPIIALYGPTAPGHVGPYNQLDQVLRHNVPCHPCRRKECDHHSCMNGLSVELVWEKTKSTLPTEPAA